MFSAPQRQLKVAFDRGSSEARSTEPSFGCRLSLSGRGPPHGREQDHSGSRQPRQHGGLPLLSRRRSRTALTDRPPPVLSRRRRRRSACPRAPARFWKPPRGRGCCDTRGPRAGEGSSGQASPGALWRGRRPLPARPREPRARGAPPWATRAGEREAEACFAPPPVLPLLGAAACHPGHLPHRLGHNGPRPHSRSAPREVAAPPLPRSGPGSAGACVEEEREEAGASQDAGLTWRPSPAGDGGALRGLGGGEEGMVVVALPQVGGLGVRDLRNGRPGQAGTLRRKVCKRGADPRSWSTEGGSGGETVRKMRM